QKNAHRSTRRGYGVCRSRESGPSCERIYLFSRGTGKEAAGSKR
uniref:Protein kinase domain-containing protein n=1 Tax=Parascaris univalens TaxID=6257 RepID=A0A914ZYU0_PARUN